MTSPLSALNNEIVSCTACPRLMQWLELVSVEKRASFREWEYWSKPVPSFGSEAPQILIVGLAPAAHGANRTGRVFTGDRSGDWLFASLHRVGLANQPTSISIDDGLELPTVRITASVHCAPPANKPTREEFAACSGFLRREVALARPTLRAIVPLGGHAWNAVSDALGIKPRPKFGHGATHQVDEQLTILGCYHPSQQNTFTGRLTETMLDDVFTRAGALASES